MQHRATLHKTANTLNKTIFHIIHSLYPVFFSLQMKMFLNVFSFHNIHIKRYKMTLLFSDASFSEINAFLVSPLPVWAQQHSAIGMTIMYVPLTVNRALFFYLNGYEVSHSSKIVCAWLLTNPVFSRHNVAMVVSIGQQHTACWSTGMANQVSMFLRFIEFL